MGEFYFYACCFDLIITLLNYFPPFFDDMNTEEYFWASCRMCWLEYLNVSACYVQGIGGCVVWCICVFSLVVFRRLEVLLSDVYVRFLLLYSGDWRLCWQLEKVFSLEQTSLTLEISCWLGSCLYGKIINFVMIRLGCISCLVVVS